MTIIYGSGDFIFKFIAFAIFPIYAHIFSVEEFGVLTLVNSLAGFIGVFLTLGMNNAVQRFYWDPATKEEQRPLVVSTGLWILLVWSVLVTALAILVLFNFQEIMRQRYSILWIFVILSLVSNIPAQILQYSQDTLRLHFAYWKFTLVSAWRNLFGVLLGIYFILSLKQGLVGIFWGNFWALIVSIPIGFWLIRQDLKWQFDKKIARELTAFGYPFIFTGLGYWLFSSMDRWMLGWLSNNTEVGLYGIAFKFSSIIVFIMTAFGQSWGPFAIKIYADEADYRQLYGRVFSYWFFGLTAVGVLVSLFAHELLQLLTPVAYWPAANLIGVSVMGLVLFGTTLVTALGISLAKKSHLLSAAAWITALVNLVLNYLFIPKWGALGAAAATLVSYAVLTGYYLYWTQRLEPIALEIKKLVCSLAIIFITILFSFYFNRYEWHSGILVAKIVLFCLILGSAFLFKIIKVSDITKLLQQGKTLYEKLF